MKPPPKPEPATPGLAIVCIIATGMLFSCLDTSAKYLVLSGMPALFVVWMRFLGHVLLVLVLYQGWRDRSMFKASSLRMQILRGLCLAGSTILNFLALKTLQLAETTSIFFFSPMIITALAGPMLGEWAGWRRWLAVGIGFVGVLVITRPGFGSFGVGHLYVLAATVSQSLYVLMTRRMSGRESPRSLLFYAALTPVVFGLPVVPFTAAWPADPWHAVVFVLLGIFGGLSHWFLVRAYRLATATALAPYSYLQMVWMIGFGYLVFGQLPDLWTLAGAAFIVASGLYIVHREHRLRIRQRAGLIADAALLAQKL